MNKYELWLNGGRFLEIFPFFNGIVAWFYRTVFVRFLSLRLNQKNFRLVVRQSARTGKTFNPFFSDLDLAAVYSTVPGEQQLGDLRKQFQQIKKTFPFLGELEIFTESEWQRRAEITAPYETLFSTVRNIRKLSWLLGDLQSAQTPYHRYKALRAMKVISSLEGLLQKFLRAMPEPVPDFPKVDLNKIQMDHLAWPHQTLLGASDEKTTALLAAITPCFGLDDETKRALQEIRRGFLLNLYLAYVEAEEIQIRAVYRARPEVFPWMDQWQKQLRTMREIKQ